MKTQAFIMDTGWPLILTALGIAPDELLKLAGLPRDLFARTGAALSAEEYYRFWEALKTLHPDPLLPLKLGQSVPVEAFNPPIFAAYCSPNLLICMQRLSRFKRLIGPLRLDVSADDQLVRLNLSIIDAQLPLSETFLLAELVFLVQLVRSATRQRLVPISVCTPIRHLDPAYGQYWGVAPSRAEQHQLMFRREDALQPFLTGNASMWSYFEPGLQKKLSEISLEDSLVTRVQAALLELLPSGQSGIQDVAGQLGLSKRTLQRRLSEANTSFQQELSQLRLRLARHYLSQPGITSAEISFLLGFDDPQSFARAFQQWTGSTPEKSRKSPT